MVAISSDEQQDVRRMSRERKRLVKAQAKQTKQINQLKAMFTELGIHDFNPGLKKAPEDLEELRTPNGKPIPPNPNALAEIRLGNFGFLTCMTLCLVRPLCMDACCRRGPATARSVPDWQANF